MAVLKTSGEISAMVGYFFQYEIFATEIYNQLLRNELEWVEFASNTSGKLDDVLLATSDTIFAYQAKEIGSSNFSYSEFTKADPESIFQGVFHGWQKIKANYPDKKIEAKFLSTQSLSDHDRIASFDSNEKPSFEKFLKNFWEQISKGNYDEKTIPKVWLPVFNELIASVKTSSSELVLFIKDFSFVFNYQVNQFVSDTYTKAKRQGHIENITKEIARVVSKQGNVKLTRAQFLSSFNLKNQFETRFQHAFFVDERHYQPITATAEALDQVIGRKRKGYIALIGNAGSGKSTLLTKWLEDGDHQVLKYYAYTNTDMSYDFGYRGEATHFLHDLLVQIREKEFSIQDRLPEKDLEDLQIHLAAELKKLGSGQQKVFIIVDGLDHIEREQQVTRSLINVLPQPNAIPDNIYFVLGSRTVSQLNELSFDIRQELEGTQSIVTIGPLSKLQVSDLTNSYHLDLSDTQLEALFENTLGHPLFLRYTIEEVKASDPDNYDEIIGAKKFKGDIYAEYRRFWQANKNYDAFVHVLGLISRFRYPYFDLGLLSCFRISGSDSERVNKLAEFYFYKSENVWQFFHNSFKEFLVEESAKNRFSGKFEPSIDASFHYEIAGAIKSSDNLYRYNYIYHLYKSGNYKLITEIVNQSYFRKQWFEFRNTSIIREDIRLAAQSGLRVNDLRTVACSFFAFLEIDQRIANFPQSEHYDLFLGAGWLDVASSFVFDSARLLVNQGSALNFASLLYKQGYKDLAGELFNKATPAKFLNSKSKLSRRRQQRSTYNEVDEVHTMRIWVSTASLFMTVGELIKSVKDLVIEQEGYGEEDKPFLEEAISALKDLFMKERNVQKMDELAEFIRNDLDGYDQFEIYFEVLRNNVGGIDLLREAQQFFDSLSLNELPSSHLMRYAIIYTHVYDQPEKRIAAFKQLETPDELKVRIKPHSESALGLFIFNYSTLFYINSKEFTVDVSSFVPKSDKPAANAYNTAFAELGKTYALIYRGAGEAAQSFFRNISKLLRMFHYSFRHPMYNTDIMYGKDKLVEQILRVSNRLSKDLTKEVLGALKLEWHDHAKYWGPKSIHSILDWVIENSIDDQWCIEILYSIESRIYSDGYLQERIEEGVVQARLWSKLGEQDKVQATLGILMSICLDMAPEDDQQVDQMVRWLKKSDVIPVSDVQWYLDRLPSMLLKVNSQTHTPAREILELSLSFGNGYNIFEYLLFEKLVPVLDGVETILIYALQLMPHRRNMLIRLFARIVVALDEAHSTRRQFIRTLFALKPDPMEIALLVNEIKIHAMTESQLNYLLEVQNLLPDLGVDPITVGLDRVLTPNDENRGSSKTLYLKDGRSFSNEELLLNVHTIDDLVNFKEQEESYRNFDWTDVMIKVIPYSSKEGLKVFLNNMDLEMGTDRILDIVQKVKESEMDDLARDLLIRAIETSRYCQWGNNYYNSGKLPAFETLKDLQNPIKNEQMALKDFVEDISVTGVQSKASLISQLDEVFGLFSEISSRDMLYDEINDYRNELLRNNNTHHRVHVEGTETVETLFIRTLFFLITTPSQFDQIIFTISIQNGESSISVNDVLLKMLYEGGYTLKFLHFLTGLSDQTDNYILKYKAELQELVDSPRSDIFLMASDLLESIGENTDRTRKVSQLPLSYTIELDKQVGLVGADRTPIDRIGSEGFLRDTNDPLMFAQIIASEINYISESTGFKTYNIAYRIQHLADELQFPEWCKNISEQELRAIYEHTLDLKIPYNRPQIQKVFAGLAKVTMELTDLEHLDLGEARQLIPFFDPALFKIKTVIKPEHIASILDTTGSAPSVDRKWPHKLTEKYVDEVITSFSDGNYILAERTVLEGMGHGRATETREAFMGQEMKISGHGPLFPFGEEMLIELIFRGC